jgi:uncharacterized repeat protein (TIGR03803 family)
VQTTNTDELFELSPNADKTSWKYTIVYTFACPQIATCGWVPEGKLFFDTAGSLYAAFEFGGRTGDGALFKLTRDAGRQKFRAKLLYSFGHSYRIEGLTYAGAAAGLPYDGASPLYGTTYDGDHHNPFGSVFQLTSDGSKWSQQKLYSFCPQGVCADGSYPSRIIVDGNGNIFGTTTSGGANEKGTVFELTNSGGAWVETTLHNFCSDTNCADGYGSNELLIDAAGNLFGLAVAGGNSQNAGTLFKIVPNGSQSQYSVLHTFCSAHDCKDGAQPMGSLIMDASGNLFGATLTGGGHNSDGQHLGGGTAFEFTQQGLLQPLHAFCAQTDCLDGEYPLASLIMDLSGSLFGTASAGGKNGEGTLFNLTP